jgi:hypothetical protein
VVGDSSEKAIESTLVNISDDTRDLRGVGGIEIAQPDDGGPVKSTLRKVTVA